MPSNIDFPRRAAVFSALGCVAGLGALAGCQGTGGADRSLSFASLAAAEDELATLASATTLVSEAVWTWAQTLEHCAQSIEYSMLGFPESKSRLFQATVGSAALQVFAWRGRMRHDLAEPIPGAPALASGAVAGAALHRLKRAIADFRGWNQPLAPHFAYGALGKDGYELAHAMHLANHLSQFQGADAATHQPERAA